MAATGRSDTNRKGIYFHPEDPLVGHVCSLLCAVATPTAERPSVIAMRIKRGKSSSDRIPAE